MKFVVFNFNNYSPGIYNTIYHDGVGLVHGNSFIDNGGVCVVGEKESFCDKKDYNSFVFLENDNYAFFKQIKAKKEEAKLEYIGESLVKKSDIVVEDINKTFTVTSNNSINIDDLDIKTTIPYKYKNEVLNIDFMPIVKEIVDGELVDFKEFKFLQKGTYIKKIAVFLKNGYRKDFDITINVTNDYSYYQPKNIEVNKFNFISMSTINSFYIKPICSMAIMKSDNVRINKISCFNENNELIDEKTNIDNSIIDFNISSLDENKKHSLTFNIDYNVNSKTYTKQIIKEIYVKKELEVSMGVSFDKETNLHRLTLSYPVGELENVSNILWRVSFESYVVQNILNVKGKKEKIEANLLFEELTGTDETSTSIEILQPGTYTIEAILIDKNGFYQKIKKQIKTLITTEETGKYKIGDKIKTFIVSKNGRIPVFKLYVFKQDGPEFINTIIPTNIFDNMYYAEFTAEENNSVYVMVVDNVVHSYRVGAADNIMVTYNKDKPVTTEFEIRDFNGDTLVKDRLIAYENGLSYYVIDKNIHGILKINDHYKVI